MDEQDLTEALTPPSSDQHDTLSAMEREAFTDLIRDQWDEEA